MVEKVNIGIFGASGYLGAMVNDRLSKREDVNVIYAPGHEEIIKINKIPAETQIIFLALPAEISIKIVPRLLERKIKVIDLSGAYRFKNLDDYKRFYNLDHLNPEILNQAVYGFPEKNKVLIRNANLIANPGCYATAINLSLLPILNQSFLKPDAKIIVNAVSGYTGAGKGLKDLPQTVMPYKSGREHQHIPEIEETLGLENRILFYPHIAPWPRGIEAFIRIQSKDCADAAYLLSFYEKFYEKEIFVRIKDSEPDIKEVVDTNCCDIFPAADGTAMEIRVAIDNLIKGGAGQAIQNMNIMCGFPEELV